jgi:outer membrane protein OmpA-like peptidoglycan-associated protein
MNRTKFRISCLAALCALVTASSAYAEDELPSHKNTLELGGFLGGFFPSNSHEFYDPTTSAPMSLGSGGLALGARAGFFPIPLVGAEAELDWTSLKAANDESVGLTGLRAQVVVQPHHGRLSPFAAVGLGMGSVGTDAETLGDDSDLLGHIGFGAKFWATPLLAVRLDARLTRGPKAEPDTAAGKGTNHFGMYLGATYAFDFGSSEEEADPAPTNDDPDDDGVLGDADECPFEAGTGEDGCPERDPDGDGILGDADNCPNEAENMNAWEDTDGCPDTIPDSDGDGLNNKDDQCPEDAEDMDSFQDEDGCPDDDNDEDGVSDSADGCVSTAGPVENRGCPDTDRDSDTVVDRLDNCPDEAGTPENHGCKKKQLVVITKNQLQILDKVFFRTGKAKVRSRSRALLKNVAAVLKAHPEIKKVRVEGHTDNVGEPVANKTLSQDRAAAVVAYLVKEGVEAGRLEAVGHGQERPLADNDLKTGREQNRRVEFNIVEDVK